ncbi:MAG: hypothetical protein ACYCSA_04475 [Thermoplasmataceae archaeon]|jgi:hypothetical protein|nr:hypothetical protein [Candidatus Thermoplasmatota archaeon]
MPSIDCSLSVAPETKKGDDFLKVIVGLSLIMVYIELKMVLKKFHASVSGLRHRK